MLTQRDTSNYTALHLHAHLCSRGRTGRVQKYALHFRKRRTSKSRSEGERNHLVPQMDELKPTLKSKKNFFAVN